MAPKKDTVVNDVAPAVADVAPETAATEAPVEAAAAVDQPAAPQPEKCPWCGATIFQGPFIRGPIVNGEIVERERLFQCVGCNQVMDLPRIQKPI